MKKDGGFRLPETIDPPTRCVSIDIPDDPEHIRAFWGTLQTLAYWFSWERDENKTALAVSQVWMKTIQAAYTRFLSDNPCGNEMSEDCVELAPHHPAIEWQPTNPFLDPYEQPSGYLAAPFSIVNLELPGFLGDLAAALGIDLAYLAGLKNGDVVSTLISIPGNPLQVLVDGLPRFTIRVFGTGTITLHLVNMPLGGLAAIGKDTFIDVPGLLTGVIGGGVQLVDLNRDIVSIPPETSTIIGQQIEFDTPGPHFVEVAFLPNLNDSVIPIGYGGGLRGVTVCGFEPLGGNNVIRVQDCKLEQSADGVNWTLVYDLDTCLAGEGIDGASVEMRVDGGFIQWRQDDDSPTWTNLIALADIKGEAGEPGTNGVSPEMRVSDGWIQWKLSTSETWNNLILVENLRGPQGIQGIPGIDGLDGADAEPGAPGAGGNEYPPRPTSSQTTPLCNAASYVVNQIRNLIVDIYAKLADTLTPAEIVDSLLARSGWSVGALYDLVAFGAGSLANEMANLAAFDAAKADLICELISYELDKAAFVDWIDVTYSGQATLRDMLKAAINSVSDQGIYATWIAVGATMTGAECDCEEPSTALCTSGTMQDFRVTNTGWLPYQSRAVYEPTLGFKRAGTAGFLTIEKLGNIAVTRVKIRTSTNVMGTAAVIRRNTQTSIIGGSTTIATLQPDGTYIWDVNVTTWGSTFGLIVRFNRTEGIPATAYVMEVCYE